MVNITVHHASGGQTVFTGDEAEFYVEDDGSLRIWKWTAPTGERGNAVFADGKWSHVIETTPIDQ